MPGFGAVSQEPFGGRRAVERYDPPRGPQQQDIQKDLKHAREGKHPKLEHIGFVY